MTLRAHRDGYVSVRQNTSQNMMYFGMTLPIFQMGDTVRPGMAVVEIQDLKDWVVDASIGELDRGHVSIGQPVKVMVVAVPGRSFKCCSAAMCGVRTKSMRRGSATISFAPWRKRRFICEANTG